MLSHPEAMIAPFLGLPRQLDGTAQSLYGAFGFMHRALVEDAYLEIQGNSPLSSLAAGINAILHYRAKRTTQSGMRRKIPVVPYAIIRQNAARSES